MQIRADANECREREPRPAALRNGRGMTVGGGVSGLVSFSWGLDHRT